MHWSHNLLGDLDRLSVGHCKFAFAIKMGEVEDRVASSFGGALSLNLCW